MKGLYVYGALVMALSFAAGAVSGSPTVMAMAVASALIAAAAEAGKDLATEAGQYWAVLPTNILAILSWLSTTIAALGAIATLMGV